MQSLYLNSPTHLELKELPSIELLKADEVKVKMLLGGICGSDLGVYKGKIEHATYPVRPGHEVIGTIVDKGENVTYSIGTRVVIGPNTFCGECVYCKAGQPNICERKKSLGVNIDGGFAEEIVMPAQFVLPIPEHITDKKAVLIEPLSVIVHAYEKVNISPGSKVAIIGCGTEGMLAISLAHFLGAEITAIDIQQAKLENVQNHFPQIKTALPEEVTNGLFDVVIEAAGTSLSVEQAVELVRPAGVLVIVGMATEAKLPIIRIVRREMTIYGSIIYNFPGDFHKSMQLLSEPTFYVDQVISKIFPFTEYEQAYQEALSGKYGKILLDFTDKGSGG